MTRRRLRVCSNATRWTDERGDWVRRATTIGATTLALSLSLGLLVWLYFWDGAVESRVLRQGDVVSVGDAITFTVPDGWEGFYDRYARVPSWVPLGAARPSMPFREFLTLRKASSADAPADLLLVQTYYGGRTPAGLAQMPRVASSADVELFSTERTMVAVVSGGFTPVFLIGSAQSDSITSIRRLWGLLDVSGVESP